MLGRPTEFYDPGMMLRGNFHRTESDLSTWLPSELLGDPFDRDECLRLLLEHDVTTREVLGSLNEEELLEITDSATSEEMRRCIVRLHQEARLA